jgi:WD40 repeat protein
VALPPGARLGQYEILSLVGAGGMGEVYHARDTKLDRDVAIKILPEALAADPHFLERFPREAKTIAALTHPNIVTLFSAEESDGRHFLTMELVPGRPLSAMIQPGDGRIVFTSTSNGNPEIWITNADGSGQTPLTQGSDANIWPCVTHDNRYIVFASSRGGPSIWRMGLAGDGLVRLTNGPADGWPLCAPDSRSVLFESLDTGFEIRKTPIDGGRREQLAEALIFPQAMSPDGTMFSGWDFQSGRQPGFAIAVRSAIDGSPIRWFAVPFDIRVSGAPFFAQAVGWAPDGKAIQYVASESGVGNIWSQPLDGGAPRRITDFDHNEIYAFAWSPDGTRLAVARGTTTNDVVIVTDTSRP